MEKEEKLDEIYLFLLERTHRQFKKYKKYWFQQFGIKLSTDQWIILKRIHENPGLSQKQLAHDTYKEPASVTRMLDLLEKKKWIKRMEQEEDRRRYGIHLTKSGQALVERILPLAKEIRNQGLKGLNEGEIKQLNALLNQICHNFSAA